MAAGATVTLESPDCATVVGATFGAVAGGANQIGGTGTVTISESFDSGSTWSVTVTNPGPDAALVTVQAVCAPVT